MLTLEEAIKHCEEEAERIERNHPYIDASEYRQLAEWLRELQRWRKLKSAITPKYRDGVLDEYNMGANDMWNEIMERIEEVNADECNL